MSSMLYYDLENLALMNGIEPSEATFQLGQVQATTFTPAIIEDVEVAVETKFPTRTPSGGSASTPGSVPVRPERWNLDTEPATYRVASGDTLVGLAKTYIHPSGVDWRMIWDEQTPERRAKTSPDVIFAEEILRMPRIAADNMRAFLALGQPSGVKPGDLTTKQKKTAKAKSLGKYVLIGGGVAGAAYLLYKSFV